MLKITGTCDFDSCETKDLTQQESVEGARQELRKRGWLCVEDEEGPDGAFRIFTFCPEHRRRIEGGFAPKSGGTPA